LTLDAAGTRDPDGNGLKYSWFFYGEAGSGIPARPVSVRRRADLEPRVAIDNPTAAKVTVTPRVAGIAHVILAVEDDGSPTLTSYRRVILTIKAAAGQAGQQ
jgi:hypothetical protein